MYKKEPIEISKWVITLVILMIPALNIIMLFVWAYFNPDENLNRRNFSRATIYVGLVLIAIGLLLKAFK